MKFLYKRLKAEIEKDLWIPPIRQLALLAIEEGRLDSEWILFLADLEKDLKERLKSIPF
jgi:hypothetical protein